MTELETLGKTYYELLEQQQFVDEDLDYALLDAHRPYLDKLAQVNNSGISVFDLYRKGHVYTSYNFAEIFGYDTTAISQLDNTYFDSRVHPEDYIALLRNGIGIMKFYYGLPKAERANYKFVNEYRILGGGQKYIRVIEQHQALEVDKHGNIWLALGVVDIAPDQTEHRGIKSQIYNYKTGSVVRVPTADQLSQPLSKRELEVLQFVKDGLLSKEISEKLFISIHTVNTHRQRILEKLGVSNSMEAINFAARLGLVL